MLKSSEGLGRVGVSLHFRDTPNISNIGSESVLVRCSEALLDQLSIFTSTRSTEMVSLHKAEINGELYKERGRWPVASVHGKTRSWTNSFSITKSSLVSGLVNL